MGKVGILEGGKGDIMIFFLYIFEGIVDNYFFKNRLKKSYFGENVKVCFGVMIIVLGILF